MSRWRARHRGSRPERGAAAVEFAIVLTVLLLVLLGIIDFGRLLFVSQAVKSASREGARAAVVDSGTGLVVFNAANNAANAAAALSAGGGVMTVTANPGGALPGTGAAPDGSVENAVLCPGAANPPVTVAVSIQFQWLTPLGALPGLSSGGLQGTRPVNSATTMRCE